MDDGATTANPLTSFSHLFEPTSETIHFQVIALEGSTYLWIGASDNRQDALALGVPNLAGGGPPASGTALLGSGSDVASQAMAQRLARKIGHPVFVSFNLRADDPELRSFAERQALTALKAIVPTKAATDVTDASTAGSANASAATTTATATAGSAAASAETVGVGARTREVFEAGDAKLGERATAMVLEAAREAIAARGLFTIALSGGSIPKLLAPSLLAAAADGGGGLDLAKWHIFLADERYVGLEHADSNMGEWKTRLLDALSPALPPSQIYPLDINLSLADAAASYEASLLRVCGGAPASAGGPPPKLDLLLLGMGPDGHTASLFPGHPLLQEEGCWVATIADSPKPPPQRITLTYPALNAARRCVFVVTGASKSPVVKSAFAPEPGVPAGHVLAAVRTHWLLDAPAAAELLEEEAKQDAMYS